jgi:D-arabinose 1-dehydrogenase-like Zn-dependent alcohol dehydrogenase
MAKMTVAQVPKAGADFQIIERDIPEPEPEHVRIRVQRAQSVTAMYSPRSGWPGLVYPRVAWRQEGTGVACRRGDFVSCVNLKVTGFSYDAGYQDNMIAGEAVARMPKSLDPVEAAPLLCAGITTLNALGHSGALPERPCGHSRGRRATRQRSHLCSSE